uniref:Integral membrane protein 2 n=1 Tax=Cuerna arida TaxID=1464854 RepID=A0A1B6EQE7_9HEMI
MTVITKPISEKKIDKLDQPLVVAECLPNQDVEGGAEREGDSLPPQDPRYLVLRARARRASSVTTACLLLMALLVMCCGVLGGFYMYKQFAHSQMHRLRGWCRIPYGQGEQGALFGDYGRLIPEFPEVQNSKADQFMREEFDIDGDSYSYEKIFVPTFNGGRSSRFIHDFNANKTGIIDVESRRCYVMPLNRSQVLPPRDLIDLVRKMWQGYYDVDTETVKETMRVVIPPITETRSVGLYIERECAGFPIYKLEKIVSGVYKRSIEGTSPFTFIHFSGKYLQFSIMNENEVKDYEREHSHT